MNVFAQYLAVVMLHEAEQLEDELYSGSFKSLTDRLRNQLHGISIDIEDISNAVGILTEFSGAKSYPDPLTGGYYQVNYDNFRYYFIQEQPDFADTDKDGYAELRAALQIEYPVLVNYAENSRQYAHDVIAHLRNLDGEGIDSLRDQKVSRVAPAANRVVPLDHNSAEHGEIADGIEALIAEVRANNKVGETGGERDQIVASLLAAKQLWNSSQLQIIQVRVGVIMAVESAGKALEKVGKAVSWPVLVELIKTYVKKQVGLG